MESDSGRAKGRKGGKGRRKGTFSFSDAPVVSSVETTAGGGTLRAYVWGEAAPLAQLDGGGLLYLHTDALGTPRLATDSTQTVRWRFEGEAFGATPPNEDPDQDQSLTTIDLRFPGQYYDAESGLSYNWNRYYDPRVGRYVTSDPIGLEGGLNTYAYVNDNPLRWVDPTGLFTYNFPPPRTQPVTPGMAQKVTCLENCLGIPLVVTGGSEPHPGYASDPHAGGVAVDFGFGANPSLPANKQKFFCCAKDCGFQHGAEHGGNHFHMESEKWSSDRNEIPSQPCRPCQAK